MTFNVLFLITASWLWDIIPLLVNYINKKKITEFHFIKAKSIVISETIH